MNTRRGDSAVRRRVLITGAGRGIGLELTRQYAAEGNDVIATCRDPERATELRALAATRRQPFLHFDVTDLKL